MKKLNKSASQVEAELIGEDIHRLLTMREPLIHNLFTERASASFIKAWWKFGSLVPTALTTPHRAARHPNEFSNTGLCCAYAVACGAQGLNWSATVKRIQRAETAAYEGSPPPGKTRPRAS